ncbi:hypothetical protein [Idiomarina abyssalis]|uniref:Lipoprotein n=1 Tax=Idiomarina abyssalis TaxID=86102 RepID=A0A8I1GAM7_9GAMM|nr:hypothetical protein [Idiomarina abyssalis]MBJ7265606.1 hypothetical protein [Idiomarina abyssalis]MBJ7316720.1 hypothetical protein [Idiomarina abyssalis]
MKLKLFVAAATALTLAGCATTGHDDIDSQVTGVHCIAYTSDGNRVVFTDADAAKYSKATGETPNCENMYQALYLHSMSDVEQELVGVNQNILELKKRLAVLSKENAELRQELEEPAKD